MGRYSLDNYEIYKTYKIRPCPLHKTPDNTGRGQINYLRFTWNELEPSRGDYHLEQLKEAINGTSNPVLILEPVTPSWVTNHEADCFAKLIRKVGSTFDKEHGLMGIVISSYQNTKNEWDSYIEAFEQVPVFADIHNHNLITYLKKNEVNFGLYVPCNEDNWIDCCETFARYNLQNTWMKAPVLLHVTDEICGPNVYREALRWHSGYSNLSLELGYNIGIRRLTYPKQISSSGAMPLRIWFVNTGSAPCYRNVQIQIKLEQNNHTHLIPLKNSFKGLIGDITHNEIVQLPIMENGIYEVSMGIFFEDGSPLKLNIEGEANKGFYFMGKVEVDDTKKEHLYQIWEKFYPEGYYPLEDPQAPESD
jgi:hypothetical protein